MNFNSQPFNYNNIIEWREVNTKRQNEQTPIQNDKTNTEKNAVWDNQYNELLAKRKKKIQRKLSKPDQNTKATTDLCRDCREKWKAKSKEKRKSFSKLAYKHVTWM